MLRTLSVPFKGQSKPLVCLHWRVFPPPGADSEDIEGEWRNAKLTGTEFQRLQVWQRICGLLKMDSVKCLTCAHARVLDTSSQGEPPMFVSLDGTKRTPALDIPTMSLQPTNRGNLETLNRPPGTRGAAKPAAWLETAQATEAARIKKEPDVGSPQ